MCKSSVIGDQTFVWPYPTKNRRKESPTFSDEIISLYSHAFHSNLDINSRSHSILTRIPVPPAIG
jgi:hypothetical protein